MTKALKDMPACDREGVAEAFATFIELLRESIPDYEKRRDEWLAENRRKEHDKQTDRCTDHKSMDVVLDRDSTSAS